MECIVLGVLHLLLCSMPKGTPLLMALSSLTHHPLLTKVHTQVRLLP